MSISQKPIADVCKKKSGIIEEQNYTFIIRKITLFSSSNLSRYPNLMTSCSISKSRLITTTAILVVQHEFYKKSSSTILTIRSVLQNRKKIDQFSIFENHDKIFKNPTGRVYRPPAKLTLDTTVAVWCWYINHTKCRVVVKSSCVWCSGLAGKGDPWVGPPLEKALGKYAKSEKKG